MSLALRLWAAGLGAAGRLGGGVAHAAAAHVERLRDIAYRPPDRGGGAQRRAHLLDVWRPRAAAGRLPVVLYLHGGGFTMLSKDSHGCMALALARRGFLVLNVNYRLAPAAPYPAACEDAAAALVWADAHVEAFGGDRARLALAGESAGANLALGLALASCAPRPEPWAAALLRLPTAPRALVPACGLLQVSAPGRFASTAPPAGALARRRLRQVAQLYLGRGAARAPRPPHLGDPLCVLEASDPPLRLRRPLPACLVVVGGRDPLLPDSVRLDAALRRAGGISRLAVYPGGGHAFHAFGWRRRARAAWRDTAAFLHEHLDAQ